MFDRLPTDWTNQTRAITISVAFALIVTAAAVGLGRDTDTKTDLADDGPVASATATPLGSSAPSATAGPVRTSGPAITGGGTVGSSPVPQAFSFLRSSNCKPKSVIQTGVTDKTITIGQIVTDSTNIPQQLRPAHEGLQAVVRYINERGGICGRSLKLEYRNDNFNPATHSADIRDLANRVLALVGNESVFDFLDYKQDPPFEPLVSGGGGFVPDVGGLAFSYFRSQSAWHAGVIGSVSPVLVGAGEYKFLLGEAKTKKTPCRKAGVVYLDEPTGASRDQAAIGEISLQASWGGNLGAANTKQYSASLLNSSVPVYEGIVQQMIDDGMNCVFAYSDLQSSIQLAQALSNKGAWPPENCALSPKSKCFSVVYVPLSAADSKFVKDGGRGARGVSTFVPHVPTNEGGNEAMNAYIQALKKVPGAQPSTFSVLGFASGLMLAQALQACPAAPTRSCLMDSLRKMKLFAAGGLLGGTTPFATRRVTYGSFGTFDWKGPFTSTVAMRVSTKNGKTDFYRINPKSGFSTDTLHVARGTPG